MKLDFANWSNRLLSVEHLKLDIDNPRFSYFSKKKMNQTEIIKFLIDRFEVYELAKEIATDGYLLNEEPIVCKEEDSYVVLEGNRRVAACKLLLNPHRYLSSQKAQNILKYNYLPDKLNCHVSPTRKDADILIYRRHTTIPVKRWETISQDAHVHKLFSEEAYSIEEIASMLSESTTNVRKALRRYHIHQYSMTLFEYDPSLKEAISNDKFPITNLERLYDYKDGIDFLGIYFTPNGEIRKRLDVEEVNRRLRFIIEEVLNDNFNSRVFNRESDKREYIDYLKSLTDKFDFSIPLSESVTTIEQEVPAKTNTATEKEHDEQTNDNDTKKQHTKNKYKLFSENNWETGIKRIDDIFKTMKTLRYDKHIDVVGIAFRCYLDMLIYEFLKKKNCLEDASVQENAKINKEHDKLYEKIKLYMFDEFALGEEEIKEDFRYLLKLGQRTDTSTSLSLRGLLQYIAGKQELFPDNRQRNALAAFLKGENNVIDLQGFNMLVHNQHYHIEPSQLENTVINLLPLLELINLTIIDE
jgi:hypothetical protein